MKTFMVYKHLNKTNGKVYIGITSQKAEKRWGRGSKYGSQHFGRAIKKYGWDNFDHIIIAENLSKEDACELEKILIKAYNSTNPLYGYNEAQGGDGGGMYNKHHTEKAKEMISQAMKGVQFTEEHKRHISEAKQGINHHFAKKVYQYTRQKDFIREWDYMSLAAKELNINKANIGEVCNGNRKTAGGFVWKYEKE